MFTVDVGDKPAKHRRETWETRTDRRCDDLPGIVSQFIRPPSCIARHLSHATHSCCIHKSTTSLNLRHDIENANPQNGIFTEPKGLDLHYGAIESSQKLTGQGQTVGTRGMWSTIPSDMLRRCWTLQEMISAGSVSKVECRGSES